MRSKKGQKRTLVRYLLVTLASAIIIGLVLMMFAGKSMAFQDSMCDLNLQLRDIAPFATKSAIGARYCSQWKTEIVIDANDYSKCPSWDGNPRGCAEEQLLDYMKRCFDLADKELHTGKDAVLRCYELKFIDLDSFYIDSSSLEDDSKLTKVPGTTNTYYNKAFISRMKFTENVGGFDKKLLQIHNDEKVRVEVWRDLKGTRFVHYIWVHQDDWSANLNR